MSKRAEQAALETYPPTHSEGKRHAKRVQSESVDTHQPVRTIFQKGYEQAEKDILSIIQARLEEIPGDAQPRPILRAELQELMIKMMEEKK